MAPRLDPIPRPVPTWAQAGSVFIYLGRPGPNAGGWPGRDPTRALREKRDGLPASRRGAHWCRGGPIGVSCWESPSQAAGRLRPRGRG